MKQRDILEDEGFSVLDSSPSKHTYTRKDGRLEVRSRVGRRELLVVYSRINDDITVINAMWEN
jgi:hypothetical protein